MVFTPIQNAFLQTTPVSPTQSVWGQGFDDTYQAWKNAIASMEQLLVQYCQTATLQSTVIDGAEAAIAPVQGLILSGPTPVLYEPTLAIHFQSCLWTSNRWPRYQQQLLPCPQKVEAPRIHTENLIQILETDPLSYEQFCVVLTRDFGWVATLSHPLDMKTPFFGVTFNPDTVNAVTQLLTSRVEQQRPQQVNPFKQWLNGFPSPIPDYHWPMQFSQFILAQSARFDAPSEIVRVDVSRETSSSPSTEDRITSQHPPKSSQLETGSNNLVSDLDEKKHDIELLKAIAHEIRTPLATIQTLTRLLIRRKDLPEDVTARLQAIQQECTHQIDRFSLIFRAIELTTTPSASLQHSLTSMSLQELFSQRMSRWESILERRSLDFDVMLPEDLPAIAIRDPSMLDQVLTGLIEQLSHTLPLGSEMSLQVTLAGEQLKLQLRSSLPEEDEDSTANKSMLKAVGQLLMLQPETGNLSLSLPATKEIFNFLGGILTVRQSPPRGEILTMFLPLDAIGSSF